MVLFWFHIKKPPSNENLPVLCLQFKLQEESLLKEYDDLIHQLRLSHLQSCFGTSSEAIKTM